MGAEVRDAVSGRQGHPGVKMAWIPHDFRRAAAWNLDRAGVSRSVAMQLTGHKTEAVYRRYAIVSESDLGDGLEKLGALGDRDNCGTNQRRGRVRRFRRISKAQ